MEATPAAEATLGFAPLTDAKEAFEMDYLRRLLTHTNGNVSEAARLARRYRADLYRLFAKYHIDPSSFKKDAGVKSDCTGAT